jgi:hypothetical protein
MAFALSRHSSGLNTPPPSATNSPRTPTPTSAPSTPRTPTTPRQELESVFGATDTSSSETLSLRKQFVGVLRDFFSNRKLFTTHVHDVKSSHHQDLSDALKAKLDDATLHQSSLTEVGKENFRQLYKNNQALFKQTNGSRDLVRFVKLGLKLGIKPSEYMLETDGVNVHKFMDLCTESKMSEENMAHEIHKFRGNDSAQTLLALWQKFSNRTALLIMHDAGIAVPEAYNQLLQTVLAKRNENRESDLIKDLIDEDGDAKIEIVKGLHTHYKGAITQTLKVLTERLGKDKALLALHDAEIEIPKEHYQDLARVLTSRISTAIHAGDVGLLHSKLGGIALAAIKAARIEIPAAYQGGLKYAEALHFALFNEYTFSVPEIAQYVYTHLDEDAEKTFEVLKTIKDKSEATALLAMHDAKLPLPVGFKNKLPRLLDHRLYEQCGGGGCSKQSDQVAANLFTHFKETDPATAFAKTFRLLLIEFGNNDEAKSRALLDIHHAKAHVRGIVIPEEHQAALQAAIDKRELELAEDAKRAGKTYQDIRDQEEADDLGITLEQHRHAMVHNTH